MHFKNICGVSFQFLLWIVAAVVWAEPQAQMQNRVPMSRRVQELGQTVDELVAAQGDFVTAVEKEHVDLAAARSELASLRNALQLRPTTDRIFSIEQHLTGIDQRLGKLERLGAYWEQRPTPFSPAPGVDGERSLQANIQCLF